MPEHNIFTRASANNHPPGPLADYLDGVEQASDPAAPGTGHRALYAKAAGWYDRDSAGTVTPLVPGVANGYAPLDSGLLVPIAYLGSGGDGSGTHALFDDGTWKTPSGGGGGGGILSAVRLIQFDSAYNSNASVHTMTLPVAPTHGLLVAFGVESSSISISSIVQTGSSWVRLYRYASACSLELWWTPAGATGTTITVNMSGTMWSHAAVMEFSGLVGTLDSHAEFADYANTAQVAADSLLIFNAHATGYVGSEPNTVFPFAVPIMGTRNNGCVFYSIAQVVPVFGWRLSATGDSQMSIARIS